MYVKWVRFMKWYKLVYVLLLICNLRFELCKLFRVYKSCMKLVVLRYLYFYRELCILKVVFWKGMRRN